MQQRSTNWLLSICTRSQTWKPKHRDWDWTQNLGTHPDQEPNLQPFGYRMMFQPTKPHWPGVILILFFKIYTQMPCSSINWILYWTRNILGEETVNPGPLSLLRHSPSLWNSVPCGGEGQTTMPADSHILSSNMYIICVLQKPHLPEGYMIV